MTGKRLSLGFIGGGINSAVGAAHFIAAQMDGIFRVDAGCFSRHDDINRQTAQRWGIAPKRLYRSWEELLENERGRLDAIVILTPTPHHPDPIVAALQAGHGVICEKALAASSRAAGEILHVLGETNGFLAVTYNYTGYPMVRELRRMIRDGRLGKLQQIHVEMPQEGFARLHRDGQPAVPQPWRLHDADLPTISLDLGVHVLHMIDFLSDEKPIELVATQDSLGHFRQVVDNTSFLMRHANGMQSNVWFSKAALGYRNGLRVRIFGDEASAEWVQMDPEELLFNDNRGHQTRIDRASVDVEIAQRSRYNRFKSGHPAGFIEAFANLYLDISERLKPTGLVTDVETDYVFSARQAWEGLVALEAVAVSAKEKKWVKVDFGGR